MEPHAHAAFFKTRRSFVVFIPISHYANGYGELSCESSQGEVKVATDRISNRHGVRLKLKKVSGVDLTGPI